jgi:hypothetical protein
MVTGGREQIMKAIRGRTVTVVGVRGSRRKSLAQYLIQADSEYVVSHLHKYSGTGRIWLCTSSRRHHDEREESTGSQQPCSLSNFVYFKPSSLRSVTYLMTEVALSA